MGCIAPFRRTCLAATPASVRAQSDGNTRSTFGSACSSADRGTSGRLPQRNPSAIAFSSSFTFIAPSAPHTTSAIMIGGAWKYVIDGEDPTVSFAISSASRNEPAAR